VVLLQAKPAKAPTEAVAINFLFQTLKDGSADKLEDVYSKRMFIVLEAHIPWYEILKKYKEAFKHVGDY
jgi:hypothetical protein